MASFSSLDSLDEEVKELINNYKNKKRNTYEPCTINNYRECLIALHEEFELSNIKYTFNPFVDLEDEKLTIGALVNLVNAVWTLLRHHKEVTEKASWLTEQNHILEQNNLHLNGLVENIKEEVKKNEREGRTCLASAQRASNRASDLLIELTEARARIHRLTKQKESSQHTLEVENKRLRAECEKLRDKFRDKCGTFMSSGDANSLMVEQLRVCDKKQKATIANLQLSNRQLLDQLLALKDELLLDGLQEFNKKGTK